MKNNFPRCLRFILLLFLVSIAFSCNLINDNNASTDALLVKAENHLKKYPDSTLIYTQTFLSKVTKKDFSDKKQLELYVIRQKAFAGIENMDSVVAVGKKIRVLASKIPDSLALANSLLLVRGEMDFSSQQEMATYLPGAIATFKNNIRPCGRACVTCTLQGQT